MWESRRFPTSPQAKGAFFSHSPIILPVTPHVCVTASTLGPSSRELFSPPFTAQSRVHRTTRCAQGAVPACGGDVLASSRGCLSAWCTNRRPPTKVVSMHLPGVCLVFQAHLRSDQPISSGGSALSWPALTCVSNMRYSLQLVSHSFSQPLPDTQIMIIAS